MHIVFVVVHDVIVDTRNQPLSFVKIGSEIAEVLLFFVIDVDPRNLHLKFIQNGSMIDEILLLVLLLFM